jgi:hypothetical protein
LGYDYPDIHDIKSLGREERNAGHTWKKSV